MTRVKVCGITNLEDARAACEAGADALGFVFAEEARERGRYIAPDEARDIIEQLPPFITTVGVCVNEPFDRLWEHLEFVDYVQLCGEEVFDVWQGIGVHTIKAFRVGPDFEPARMLECPAAAYLVDASVPGAHGGTGQTCDWSLARKAVTSGRPLILAGGLTPENVAEAIRIVQPYAVDVSGGVEGLPGKKDHERLRSFIQHAKGCVSG